ncbi:ankyrin repeat domain-containing protein [Wolbachia pipientis]|uniref:ankyrin repeat domain-containing protein n=1 Tax=Wolbachia pipientis TaxID=955 RepID=UPI0025A33895|nr:ankyrin repeat domain-containing protein [Wolbachia pipientis]MDM8335778.1 ankyrin repeat domain-containing protein [Wolbachia pipientis]
MHCATRFCNEGAISALLRVKGIDVNAINKGQQNSFIFSCLSWNNKEAFNILIERGANVEVVDKDGNTPLHLVASRYDDKEVVKALIENGASVKVVNKNRSTTLHLAATSNERIVMILIENGEILYQKKMRVKL